MLGPTAPSETVQPVPAVPTAVRFHSSTAPMTRLWSCRVVRETPAAVLTPEALAAAPTGAATLASRRTSTLSQPPSLASMVTVIAAPLAAVFRAQISTWPRLPGPLVPLRSSAYAHWVQVPPPLSVRVWSRTIPAWVLLATTASSSAPAGGVKLAVVRTELRFPERTDAGLEASSWGGVVAAAAAARGRWRASRSG